MQLIADSGSTKTTWLFQDHAHVEELQTIGINPVRDAEESIRQTILPLARQGVTEVFFYGAGCIAPYSAVVCQILEEAFAGARVCVESDLLGAARALCGHSEGIACILGTGSNSCLYDGRRIVKNVSPLGWILGDEGSGAVLGRCLVGDMLKEQFPLELQQRFEERFHLTRASVIEAVYRQPLPNRFLASLVPFLAENRQHPAIHDFLLRQFSAFLTRNVQSYGRKDLPVNYVGGVAYQFESELREASRLQGYSVGRIERAPIGLMAQYHAQEAS